MEQNVRRWWEVLDARAGVAADPINPEYVFAELSPRLPDDAMISADSGSGTNWYARHVKIRGTMRGTLSGTLATMGCAVPYAIGAKFAHPDRPGVALVGDGAMQMNGMAELITIAKYWPNWADPRLVIMVLQNDDLNQVTWELRAMGGSPQFLPSQQLPSIDYAGFASSLGLIGITVEETEPGRIGVGRGVRRRTSVRDRVQGGSGHSADPAPRHLGPAGRERQVHPARRLRSARRHQGRGEDHAGRRPAGPVDLMSKAREAVVIGAGPNGLVAANLLADAGWDVLLLEAEDAVGGAVKSDSEVADGFVHDTFSSFYPMAAVSPVIKKLRLEQHGLTWRRAPAVLGHPLPDGDWALLHSDVDATARALESPRRRTGRRGVSCARTGGGSGRRSPMHCSPRSRRCAGACGCSPSCPESAGCSICAPCWSRR